VIHVQRTVCDKTGRVKITKDKEDRHVPLSQLLATWLQRQLETVQVEAR